MTTKLVIASGKSAGKTIAIKRDQLLVGRAEECDVRPLSDEVSRRHCAVRIEPDVVWVEDLGSRNGTLVNGTKITEKTKVYDGDLIKVGNLELRVSGGTERKPGTPEAPVAAPPASWNDEDEVSRWLLADSTASGIIHDTTQTSAVPTPADPPGPDNASPEADRSGITRINIDELKASRNHPSGLPQEAKKTAASSREAAAEALKKLFGNR
ncbi:MAG: FHA domain-containing protein [Planctomycetia bacterium]